MERGGAGNFHFQARTAQKKNLTLISLKYVASNFIREFIYFDCNLIDYMYFDTKFNVTEVLG